MRQRYDEPLSKQNGNQQRSKNAGYRSFPSLLGTENWSKRMLTDGPANKIRGRVADPSDNHHKHQQNWTDSTYSMKRNPIRQWKGHQQETATADSGGRQSFHLGALGAKCQRCNTHQKDKQDILNGWTDA